MKAAVKRAYWGVCGRLMMAKANAAEKLFAKTKGASHFVEILIAIVIIIAVGAIFKDQIIAFIRTITGQATTNASNLF